jgi:hypothetical protein
MMVAMIAGLVAFVITTRPGRRDSRFWETLDVEIIEQIDRWRNQYSPGRQRAAAIISTAIRSSKTAERRLSGSSLVTNDESALISSAGAILTALNRLIERQRAAFFVSRDSY